MAVVKYLLFIVNVIFVVLGAALCIAGAICYTNTAPDLINVEDLQPIFGDVVMIFLIVAMVLGAVIFVISFLGCCGAIKENICMLSSYSVILIMLAVLKTSLLVYFYFKKDQVYGNIPVVLNNFNTKSSEMFHEMERRMRCCGVENNIFANNLTESCCEVKPCTIELKYPRSCSDELYTILKTYELMISIIISLIIVFELLAAIVSCCLGQNSRKESNYTPYDR